MPQSEKIKHYRQRLYALEEERRGWEGHWRELASMFLPRRSRFLHDGSATSGGKTGPNLVDSTGILAARTLASGMQSGLTSPARQWFRLTTQNARAGSDEAMKIWIDQVQNAMNAVFSRSNFYDSVHLLYQELGVFGTACMVVEEDPKTILRCRTLTAGEYSLDTGASGRVNTLYRRVRMKPRQVLEAWPDTCPEQVRKQAADGKNHWLEILHAVEPNPEGAAQAGPQQGAQFGGNKKRPFNSCYLLLDGRGEGQTVLEESGYYEFPALCPRWDINGAEVYGKSPGMDALGDCKLLQRMRKDGVEALAKEVNPPLLVPATLQGAALNSTPGAINYISPLAQGQQSISPLYQVKSNLPALEGSVADFRRQVQQIFFNDLFLMITQVDRRMTATEVAERNAEKMLLLGPVLDRLRSELFQPLIERVFGIMLRAGAVPPPPEGMASHELKIEFVSVLAQAQKAAGIAAVQQIVSFAGQSAQLYPDVLDLIDFDVAIGEVADMLGVPPKVIRPPARVAEFREAKAAQAAQAQQMQALQQGVGLAGNAAKLAKDMGMDAQDLGMDKNSAQQLTNALKGVTE